MQEPINPYSTPEAILNNPIGVNAELEVSGKLIVIDNEVYLPEYCFITGESTTTEKRRKKTLYYVSSILVLLIFLGIIGIIIYLIINYTTRKKAVIHYSLSSTGKKLLMKKRLYGILASIVVLGLTIFAFRKGSDEMVGFGFVGVVLFITALIITTYIGSVMRVKKYKHGLFYISGSGQKFRDRLIQQQPRTIV